MMLRLAYAQEVEGRSMTFNHNENIEEYLDIIAEVMTSTSTKCGILLCGTCGNGKTTTLNAFYRVCKYVDALNFRAEQKKGNHLPSSWQLLTTTARRISQCAKDEHAMAEAKKATVLCIDDVGLEPTEVLDFGNAINPVIEIMEQRYNKQLFTFITTNLTPSQIREKYGDRIADRFNETMKCIVYKNSTFRR
jgi:DNA replication protein DnaC